jgi:peptidoglycan-associated lipoprotein
MKRLFTALCWAVIIGGVLGACAKKPRPTVPETAQAATIPSQEEKAMPDPNEKILDLEAPNWTIYFGLDSFALREVYKAAALGDWMKKTGQHVFLAGYASEEGTEEYNMALGARRAQAVRDYLEAYGVPADRISWRSFGEENPVTTDPDKIKMNRRVEIKIEGVTK